MLLAGILGKQNVTVSYGEGEAGMKAGERQRSGHCASFLPRRGTLAVGPGMFPSCPFTDQKTGRDGQECHRAAGKPHVPALPLISAVGQELKAAGLDVGIDVYPDLVSYEVLAEIVV